MEQCRGAEKQIYRTGYLFNEECLLSYVEMLAMLVSYLWSSIRFISRHTPRYQDHLMSSPHK